ncbi:MAG: hypothetical protein U0165_02355 [Polyangiaceae bacterium]
MRQDVPAAALVCIVYVIAALVARTIGAESVSDDDFARVVIAQSFSHQPVLDPSGTSWLPMPFWLNGMLMIVAGPALRVARFGALVGAAVAGGAMFTSARWMGARRGPAIFASVLPLTIPLVPVLGASTVPELPTAAAMCLSLCALVRPSPLKLGVASAALLAATLSRYEAWFVALYFAVACLVIARSKSRATSLFRSAVGAAACACVGPLGWIIWNAHGHHDAFRFISRVTSYRNALVSGQTPSLLWSYPSALLIEGGAIVALALLTVLLRAHRARRVWLLAPAVGGAIVLLLALSFAEARGGAPTHHPERAISSIWFVAAAVLATYRTDKLKRWAGVGLTITGLCVLQGSARAKTTFDGLVDRREAVRLGEEVARVVAPSERVMLLAHSYDHFAMMSALARPWDVSVLVPKGVDPRVVDEDPLVSEASFRAAMSQRGTRHFVARGQQRDRARALAESMALEVSPLATGDLLIRF